MSNLTYEPDESLQVLRDKIFSHFIAHPEEVKDYPLEGIRQANSFYDFVIPYPKTLPTYEVRQDPDGWFWVVWNGYKMYLPFFTEEQCRNYINSILYEQSPNSPHKYPELTKTHNIIVDCGAAEGFFVLNNIDKAQLFILVEPDEKWRAALEKTFEDFENVKIVDAMLGSGGDDELGTTKLQNVVNIIPGVSYLLKMDIEGAELSTIIHSEIQDWSNVSAIVCCYHREGTAEALEDFAKYCPSIHSSEFSKGWMLFPYDTLRPPFFRKGLIFFNL